MCVLTPNSERHVKHAARSPVLPNLGLQNLFEHEAGLPALPVRNHVTLQPPLPLQLFWPLQLLLSLPPLQPPWPLHEFLPLQSCLPVSLLGALVPGF